MNTHADLFNTAATIFQIPPSEITAHTREQRAIEARWCIAWVLRRQGLPLTAIGRHMQRDHTTILSNLRRIKERPDLLALAAQLANVRSAA